MILVVLAAIVLCASGEAQSPPDISRQSPEVKAAEAEEARLNKLGPPGHAVAEDNPGRGDGVPPGFLVRDGGEGEAFRGSPHQVNPEAKYKPKIWLGADAKQPSADEIRLEVERRLQKAPARPDSPADNATGG